MRDESFTAPWGIWDTFIQDWVVDELYISSARAAVAAGKLNAAYVEAMNP